MEIKITIKLRDEFYKYMSDESESEYIYYLISSIKNTIREISPKQVEEVICNTVDFRRL